MNTPPERLTIVQIRDITRALVPFAPAAIYVFGSYGTPSQHPSSDLDLAFLPTLPVDPIQIFQIANHLAGSLGFEVDLVDLNRASTVFRKEVIRTGAPIHIGDSSLRRRFEMYALSDYARLNEERREIITQ
jgi:predicted nucleotidyltransferase